MTTNDTQTHSIYITHSSSLHSINSQLISSKAILPLPPCGGGKGGEKRERREVKFYKRGEVTARISSVICSNMQFLTKNQHIVSKSSR